MGYFGQLCNKEENVPYKIASINQREQNTYTSRSV